MSTEQYGYIIVAFDIENTGPSLKNHAIVQIGLKVFEATKARKSLDEFQILINVPENRGWDTQCEQEFWNSTLGLILMKQQIQSKQGYEPKEAMTHFQNYLFHVFKKYSNNDIRRIRLVSDTVSFDTCWINYYLDYYLDALPLHLVFGKFKDVLETGSYVQGRSGINHEEELVIAATKRFSQEQSCIERRNILDKPLIEHSHNALEDASNIGEMYLIIMYSSYIEQIE